MHADRAYVPIHSYFEVMNRDLTEFRSQHLENPNWFRIPEEYRSINSHEFRDWAMSYNPPEASSTPTPSTSSESSAYITRNTSTMATDGSSQVNRLLYLDDSVNTNNTNNNVDSSDTSSDLEDHSYVVNHTITVPAPANTPSYNNISSLPPSTNASPANQGGATLNFSLSDCDMLAAMLDEYRDDPPLCIEGSPTGVQTRLILRDHQEESSDTDESIPDLVAF
jgi:hypothetical protein